MQIFDDRNLVCNFFFIFSPRHTVSEVSAILYFVGHLGFMQIFNDSEMPYLGTTITSIITLQIKISVFFSLICEIKFGNVLSMSIVNVKIPLMLF